MKIPAKYRYLRLFALLTVGICGLLYAAAVFMPSSQPPVTLGMYALKSRDLTKGPTKAYRSWFENGAWQGDIIEYDILQDGTRTTTAPVGSNDPAVLLPAANDDTKNWMARAEFLKKETDIVDYWKEITGRHIITYNSQYSPHTVPFLWTYLSAPQKLALDAITIADPDGDPTTNDAVDPTNNINQDDYFSPILNFIRGDRSNERDKPGGFLRRRYSLLGDVTNSPVYIGPPQELFGSFPDYSTCSTTTCTTAFTTLYANRRGRVAVPANDGMLHILDAGCDISDPTNCQAGGTEVFAYVPSMVIPKLDKLAGRDSAYEHTYYLDGELTAGSAQRNGSWGTFLAGGGGPGFIGMFALDMTKDAVVNKIVFEKNVNDAPPAPVDALGNPTGMFGHIYGPPQIAPLGTMTNPKWYVFTGNGYRNTTDFPNHPSALLMVSLDNPDNVISIPTGTKGGLSAPTLLTSSGSLIVDRAFAGDINGDLWMFTIKPDGSGTAYKIYSGDPDQPIENRPAIAENPNDPGSYFVYFGTGSIFSEADAYNDGYTQDNPPVYDYSQGIYGLRIKKEWIDDPSKLTTPLKVGNLKTQALADIPLDDPFTGYPESVRYFGCDSTDPNYPNCQDVDYTTQDGWYLPFPDCGERLVGAPFVRTGRVQFVTTNPTGDLPSYECGSATSLPGNSWVMSLDFITGGDGNNVVYNLNGDTALDDNDKVGGQLPVGLKLGKGNIAQPTLARLANSIDKMYINGLILAIPLEAQTGPLLSGHIDVETDSPWNGTTSTNSVDKESELYQVQTPDGLGRAIDGHVHEYDTIHGVDYVDLFQLEPRRGLPSLAASTPSTDPVNGECNNTVNHKQIKVVDKNGKAHCVEAVEGELNRAYDTISKGPITNGSCSPGDTPVLDDKGKLDYCLKAPVSEVFEPTQDLKTFSLSNPLLDPNQKFIVVLANADLSFAGTLQIGCRTWPVKAYQDWITPHLDGLAKGTDISSSFFTTNHLVVTLGEILDPNSAINKDITCPSNVDIKTGAKTAYSSNDAILKGLSMTPTLRIGFGKRALLDDGVLGTRAQCVLGLHDYHEPVCYSDEVTLKSAAGAVSAYEDPNDPNYKLTPASYTCSVGSVPDATAAPLDYLRDPAQNLHITQVPADEGYGFRWRNGALTMQLLAVSSDYKVQFTLQPLKSATGGINYLPVNKAKKRIGGTYAYAYEVTADNSSGKYNVHSKNPDTGIDYKGTDQSGLLYEASMFWHYSDLADELRTSPTGETWGPASTPCYGDPSWKARMTQEQGGLTLGEYKELTDVACTDSDKATYGVCPLQAFAALLVQIDNAETEDQLNQALQALADLLADHPDLARYAKYRDYAPGHVPEQQLLPWDRNLDNTGDTSSSADGTPATVTTIENIDLESLGPNRKVGRRTWIDLRQ